MFVIISSAEHNTDLMRSNSVYTIQIAKHTGNSYNGTQETRHCVKCTVSVVASAFTLKKIIVGLI